MIGELYNSKDKSIILIVQDISNKHVFGFNMRTESIVKVLIDNIEKTSLDIYNYIGIKDTKTIALIAQYHNQNKQTIESIANTIGISKRTLFRYIKEL